MAVLSGAMIALYRMIEQDWSAQAALAELMEGGYGFHPVWKNISRYVRKADVAQLRAQIASGVRR